MAFRCRSNASSCEAVACWNAFEPPLELALDRDGVQLVPALPPVAADEDDPGALQHAEVLHHRVARELGEHLAESGRRHRAVPQGIEDRAPMRRPESLPYLFVGQDR